YLSPEQARGETVDARSDVYAAGCVLYELVTGDPPFTGDSPVAVAYQHVREDPDPPSARNASVSGELDAVVLKALAKGPANRYQSAAEMRSDLVRALSGQRTSAPMVMSDEQTRALDNAAAEQQPFDDYDPDYYADEAEADSHRRKRRAWLTALLTVVGIGIVAFFVWLFGLFDSAPEVKAVPNVTGQTEAAAKSQLHLSGFDSIDTKQVTCPPLPGDDHECSADQQGKVVIVDPQEGEQVQVTEQIVLTIGAEPGQVSVPDLSGMTVEDAKDALKSEDLRLGEVNKKEVDDPDLVGEVLDEGQEPSSGTSIEAGEKVDITVGKAPPKIAVTDYTGKSFQAAKAGLT